MVGIATRLCHPTSEGSAIDLSGGGEWQLGSMQPAPRPERASEAGTGMASKPAEVVDVGADRNHHRTQPIMRLRYEAHLDTRRWPQDRLDVPDEHGGAASEDDIVATLDDYSTISSYLATVTDGGPATSGASLGFHLKRWRCLLWSDHLLAQPR